MELNIKVEQLLQPQTFSKKDGSQCVRNSFVGITTTGQYDKRVKFDVLNQETWGKMQLRVGGSYNVSFDIESREWNGKWFTSCNAWKAISLDAQNHSPQQSNLQPQPQYASNGGGTPF